MNKPSRTDGVDPMYISVAKRVNPIALTVALVAILVYVMFFYPHLPSTVWFRISGGKIATHPIAYSNVGLLLQLIISFVVSLIFVIVSFIISRAKSNSVRALSVIFAILPTTFLIGFIVNVYIWAIPQRNLAMALTYDQANNYSHGPESYLSFLVGLATLGMLAIYLLVPYFKIKKSR